MYSLVAGWFVVCHLVPRAGDFALLPYSLALLFMVSGALHKALSGPGSGRPYGVFFGVGIHFTQGHPPPILINWG